MLGLYLICTYKDNSFFQNFLIRGYNAMLKLDVREDRRILFSWKWGNFYITLYLEIINKQT